MKKLLIILTVLLVLGSSCTEFLSVNEKNPNNASYVPANLILPAAQNATASFLNNPYNFQFVYTWFGCWSISGGYSQDANMTSYNLNNSHYQNNWYYAYTTLQNFDYVEKNSTEPNLRAYRAIAKIMKALHFQVLVDQYNNVPYSEALKTDQGILKPKYDPAQDIYEDLVVQLDTAIALINNLPGTFEDPGAHDIMYNGNMTLWKKFANTLKLRILMNQSGRTDRASYISAALATTPHTAADYIGAGEGAMSNPGYLQSTGKMNPFYEQFYKQDNTVQNGMGYFAAGKDANDFMAANNDPRRTRIFAPYSGTLTDGNIFGTVPLLLPSVCSKIGAGLIETFNADSPILPDYESLLLQAEAVTRGFFTGDTLALYETAVTQSIISLGGTAPAAATYLAQPAKPDVNWRASGANPLKAIITQKWLALNGKGGISIWDDWRRTYDAVTKKGYPDFLRFSQDNARLNDTPCIRLQYPQTEISTNNDNVILQGTINLFTSKIFWMN